MHCTKRITDDIIWLGVSDRRLAMFENAFPIPRGVSYNSFLIKDEKTVLLDTVDKAVSGRFFENLAFALEGRALDYIIVNHMEPDHCATLGEIILRHPNVRIVVNAKTLVMIKQFFDFDIDSRAVIVKEGDTLATGRHTLSFYTAPMVHWPEVMVTYDAADKVLFSADAFGTFGAISGNIFADEVDFEADWLPDARRYYANIVGKYGTQVTALLTKASALEIDIICPLHGPVWRQNIGWYLDKYKKWAAWEPEEKGLVIAYASIYGNTENAADILASKLADRGIKNIAMYDVSAVHPSYILADCFRFSHIVFASSTYNGGIFPNMETLLLDIKAHLLQNRTMAFMENGTWVPMSAKLMKELISPLKNTTVLDNTVTIKSSLKPAQEAELESLADVICSTLK
ncbi:MAG: FprA family A-type flavoprotein [Clostridiales bacterium]|jgi:flavorubredoxin|nr:FprA family A-type flavoprotein [Clostridiales bacterium]